MKDHRFIGRDLFRLDQPKTEKSNYEMHEFESTQPHTFRRLFFIAINILI